MLNSNIKRVWKMKDGIKTLEVLTEHGDNPEAAAIGEAIFLTRPGKHGEINSVFLNRDEIEHILPVLNLFVQTGKFEAEIHPGIHAAAVVIDQLKQSADVTDNETARDLEACLEKSRYGYDSL